MSKGDSRMGSPFSGLLRLCDLYQIHISLFCQPKGQRPLFEYLSFKPVKNPVIKKLIFYLHEKGHEVGFNQGQWPNKPETLLIDLNAQQSFDVPIEIKENIRIKDCKNDEEYG